MICTWEGCQEDAKNPQITEDGEQWANLCDFHNIEFGLAIIGPPKKLLRAWVLSRGGAKTLLKIQAITRGD